MVSIFYIDYTCFNPLLEDYPRPKESNHREGGLHSHTTKFGSDQTTGRADHTQKQLNLVQIKPQGEMITLTHN